MTSPPLDYRKEAADRLTRASNTFPAHIDRDGVGWIRVRQDDVFAILGERDALLADNARLREYFEAREHITQVGVLNATDEALARVGHATNAVRQALSGANHGS